MTKGLTRMGREARASGEAVDKHNAKRNKAANGKAKLNGLAGSDDETDPLLDDAGISEKKRRPLWLLIFPEGTITSDEERVKSVAYSKRENIVSHADR